MAKATVPDYKTGDPLTVGPWTLAVALLGLDKLTEPQAAYVRRHVDQKLTTHAKPSPPGAKGEADTGLSGKGFILVSTEGELPKVFLGIGLKSGCCQLYWELLGQDSAAPAKGEGLQPHQFSSALSHVTSGELLVLGALAS